MFKDLTPNRNCFCCLLVFGTLIVIPVCIFLAMAFGLGEDLMRWRKSFDFPAIEARSKPFSDLLTMVTQDVIITEEKTIDHVNISVTHPEEYTGIVGVFMKSSPYAVMR